MQTIAPWPLRRYMLARTRTGSAYTVKLLRLLRVAGTPSSVRRGPPSTAWPLALHVRRVRQTASSLAPAQARLFTH